MYSRFSFGICESWRQITHDFVQYETLLTSLKLFFVILEGFLTSQSKTDYSNLIYCTGITLNLSSNTFPNDLSL